VVTIEQEAKAPYSLDVEPLKRAGMGFILAKSLRWSNDRALAGFENWLRVGGSVFFGAHCA